MKIVLKVFLLLLALSLLLLLAVTLFLGFDSCLDYTLEAMGSVDLKDKAMKRVSSTHFHVLQAVVFLSALFFALAAYKLNFYYSYIGRMFQYGGGAIRRVFADVRSVNALLVLAIPFASSIYYGLTMPVSYDEAYTYVLFTAKPFYVSMMYYPVPNNHILHSLLTNVSECLPGVGLLFSIRIPAILASILAWIVSFSFVKRFYSEKVAMFVVGLSSLLFLSIYYSYMSRGYALMFLLFVICLFAVFSIIRFGNKNKYWVFFAISSTLAFYTIPSFLYLFLTLNALLLLFNAKGLRKQLLCLATTAFTTIALYLPIVIVNGVKSLAGNKYVAPRSRLEVLSELPSFAYDAVGEIFGFHPYVIIFLVAAIGVALVYQKKRMELVMFLTFLVAPFVLLLLHSVIPFPRTFAYCGFILVLFLGIALIPLLNKVPYKWLILLVISAQCALVYNFDRKIYAFEGFNIPAKKVNDLVVQKGETAYVAISFRYVNHRFEMSAKDCDPKTVVYDEFVKEVDADTLCDFHYVIIDQAYDRTKVRTPYFSNERLNVYRK